MPRQKELFLKKRLFSLIQLAIGIALVAFLFATMKDRSDLGGAVREAATQWPLLLAGVMLFAVCLSLATLRWHILLRAQGLKLPITRTFSLGFIGHFFNSFLFGVTGGDLVKAYYVARETNHKKAEAISTIFLDRIIGLLALLILIAIVMVWRIKFFLAYRETQIALLFFGSVTIAAAVGLAVVFSQDLFEKWPFFVRLKEKTSFGAILSRVYDAFQVGLTHPSVLLKTMTLSLINHLTLVCSIALLGHALGINISFVDYLTTMLLVNAVAASPLTPGGLGTRETAAKFLLGVLGVQASRAVLLSLLLYGSQMCWSLVGGLVYLVFACRSGRFTGNGDEELN
jgi:hypothetical protein